MKPLISYKIDTVAKKIAEMYKDFPIQGAFIFDRIFIRDTVTDLQPELQFTVLGEDTGTEFGDMAREIHQEYKQLDSCEKKEWLEYAKIKFCAEFETFNNNFLDCYKPGEYVVFKSNTIPSGDEIFHFDAVVDRINKDYSKQVYFINTFSGVIDMGADVQKTFLASVDKWGKWNNSLFNSPLNINLIKLFANGCADYQKQLFSLILESYEQIFVSEVYKKHFGDSGVMKSTHIVVQKSTVKGHDLVLEYHAAYLVGQNILGEPVMAQNVHELRTFDLRLIKENCPAFEHFSHEVKEGLFNLINNADVGNSLSASLINNFP